MGDDGRDDLDAVTRLLARLGDAAGTPVPTSAFGRLRRTAGAAARLGAGQALSRLRGAAPLDDDAIAKLVLSLGELKGVAMKVGQIASYVGAELPSPARRQLALLQRRSQPTPFEQVEAIVREELGAEAGALLAGMEREPVATASIGQVHRGRLPDGTAVAVKVRHPGIDTAIRADFKSAQIGKVLGGLLVPGANVAEIIAEAEERFLEECDYANERRQQERFAQLFAAHPSIRIPAVHGRWCSARVLTSSWAEGRTLEQVVAGASQAERNHLGRALYDFYVGALCRHGVFNADPHPGNLLFQDDGGLVVLDHGCVREFDEETVGQIKALSRAVLADDSLALRAALVGLGAKEPDAGAGFAITRRMLRGFFGPALEPGVHRVRPDASFDLRQIAADKRNLGKMRLPGRLLFLFRIRFGLHAVLSTLGAEQDWQALERELTTPSPAPTG